jgi:curved DNA-binding protein CbpA
MNLSHLYYAFIAAGLVTIVVCSEFLRRRRMDLGETRSRSDWAFSTAAHPESSASRALHRWMAEYSNTPSAAPPVTPEQPQQPMNGTGDSLVTADEPAMGCPPIAEIQTAREEKREPEPLRKSETIGGSSPKTLPDAVEEQQGVSVPGWAEQPGVLPQIASHYEALQISPNADMETIHRVYRIMASRFHPDNPKSGNAQKFYALCQAYQCLSDPERRAVYDATYRMREAAPMPIFQSGDFIHGVKGEDNRRLGVLSLLYNRRRINENRPSLSVLALENRMAIPREHLQFTLWYLRSKGYIRIEEENSDYALTAEGVDYVEAHSSDNKLIRALLSPPTGAQSQPASSPIHVMPVSDYAPATKRKRNGMASNRAHSRAHKTTDGLMRKAR